MKEYWNEVFEPSLEQFRVGRTPNPDILCNRMIKFSQLYRYVFEELNVDYLATGLLYPSLLVQVFCTNIFFFFSTSFFSLSLSFSLKHFVLFIMFQGIMHDLTSVTTPQEKLSFEGLIVGKIRAIFLPVFPVHSFKMSYFLSVTC